MDAIEETRALAQLPLIHEFNGVTLHNYTGGRRGMVRGVTRKFPDLSGTMLGWVLVYGLTLDTPLFVKIFAFPDNALTETVLFADANSANEDEAMSVASSIFENIDAATVKVTGKNEGDPKA